MEKPQVGSNLNINVMVISGDCRKRNLNLYEEKDSLEVNSDAIMCCTAELEQAPEMDLE